MIKFYLLLFSKSGAKIVTISQISKFFIGMDFHEEICSFEKEEETAIFAHFFGKEEFMG